MPEVREAAGLAFSTLYKVPFVPALNHCINLTSKESVIQL